MMTNASLHSDLAIPPGEYLQEVLDDLGMSQAELARRIDRPAQAVNEIIRGHKAITPETALQLSKVTRVSDNVWLGLEKEYQLVKALQKERKQLDDEIALVDAAVYRSLANLGYVKPLDGRGRDNRHDRVREMLRFFGVASLYNVPNVQTYQAAFRVSRAGNVSPYSLAAWLRCGELQAARINTPPFDAYKLRALVPELRQLTTDKASLPIRKLQACLADCGVAFVLVDHLPKTKAQGATFWVSPYKVVLQMTLRYNWADIFWFSFFHELGHILSHGKRHVFVDEVNRDVYHDVKAKQMEDEADNFARNTLIPPEPYKRFVLADDFSTEAIQAFAQDIDIAPGIIVGRLHYDGHLVHNQGNNLRQKYQYEVDS